METLKSFEESKNAEETSKLNSSEKQEIIPIGMAGIIQHEDGKCDLLIRNMKLNQESYESVEQAKNAYYNDMWVQDMKLAALTTIMLEKFDQIERKFETKTTDSLTN